MKLPQTLRNWISMIGATIALLNIVFIVLLLIITFIFDIGSSYIGLFIYIVLPIFLVTGLLLIPIGMFLTKRRLKKLEKSQDELDWPVINFNNQETRNAAIIFTIGSLLLFIFSAVGSYEAFHYTESVEFCGKLCHTVMEPEYVAYQGSSHERVSCVQCHVGSGADWYVKSKLSGLYQVYSVLMNKYPRPIPTPVHNLRPAQQTCEQCHWPEKFYDRKLRIKRSYLADEQNTEWDIHMQMKTSAQHSALGIAEGIHWHINPDVKIEYIATDKKRGDVPWVKYTNLKTGETTVYEDSGTKLSQGQRDSLETRTMDCLDCHNRPSHDYQVPQNFIDKYIISGAISKELPDIKSVAMGIFVEDFPTTDSAFTSIKMQVNEYYEIMYPELLESKKQDIKNAIASIQEGYAKNFFPEMKVNWREYPNHLGHMETNGCYRCHNDKHTSSQGKVISRDCNLCHNITAQGTSDNMEISVATVPLEFKHPIDINEAWRVELCSGCHNELY
ncbi:NapC/NirT family cytochrome c [Draconibacterium sp.]|nr:NapC/NirT family cytochrome c [Draconibacterium sp.]